MATYKLGSKAGTKYKFKEVAGVLSGDSPSYGGGNGDPEKCLGGGDECKAFDKDADRVPRPTKEKKRKIKKEKKKGVVETKHYTQPQITPAMEVAQAQVKSGGETTGWRESEGKSPSEFKKEVQQTNIHKSDSDISGDITPETRKQTHSEKTYTKKNKRGKEKMSIKLQGTTDRDTDMHTSRSGPSDATITKNRLIGKDKVRKFTTEADRAQKNKGRTPDVKLISKKKMAKKTKRTFNKLQRGTDKIHALVRDNKLTRIGELRKKQKEQAEKDKWKV